MKWLNESWLSFRMDVCRCNSPEPWLMLPGVIFWVTSDHGKEWDFGLLADVSLRVLNFISIMRCPSALISKSLTLHRHFCVVLEEEVLCVESTSTCVAMGSTRPPDTWGLIVSWSFPPASSDLVSFYLWGSQGLSSFQASLESNLKGDWISFTSHFVF